MSRLLDWMTRRLSKRVPLAAEQQHRLAVWRALPKRDPEQPLCSSRCVVVDVETSGLDLREDSLISIGAVAVVGGRITLGDSYSVVLQQENVSERKNILVHGIGGSAQRDGVPAEDALLGFLEYLGKDPLVAFHVTFDETMIRRAIREHLGINFKHPWVDLAYVMPALNLPMARKYHSLDDWVSAFTIRNVARHDALADALATAQLLLVATAQACNKNILTFKGLCDLEKSYRWLGAGN
ncbi:MAG: 3'-5' exonuclease [Gallionella sp.]